jgi:3-deoxy-manno-octulosonate cytidylyltransferase (CMP-KDO synthetase)
VKFKIVIPARLGSTRLPRKVLLPIHGQPLIRYVHGVARASGAEEIVIAADHAEIINVCRGFGADTQLTATSHQSGTDRTNEVAQARKWAADTIVVSLQGDEPMMPPAMLREAANLLANDVEADIATLAHRLHNIDEWKNPNFVKVVVDERGRALYFSRASIPWKRAQDPAKPDFPGDLAVRHVGLYAFRVGGLARFAALPPHPLEQCEALEQLRALAHGMKIRVGITTHPAPRGVDTEEDWRAVARQLPPLPNG